MSPNSLLKQNLNDANSQMLHTSPESIQNVGQAAYPLTNGHMQYHGTNGFKYPTVLASLDKSAGHLAAPFCFSCGTQFPVAEARFCCGCGMQRAFISEAPS